MDVRLAALGFAAVLILAACGGTPRQAVAPPTPTTPIGEYRIGPGDQLQVFVFDHPELSVNNLPVRPDGRISTPLVENVQAAGKTPSELAREMEKMLAEYVRTPTVNVMVLGFVGGDQIRVVGQAVRPQSLPYRANMTLLDVMIQVGGLSQFAAGNRARITRVVGDKQETLRVRLHDLVDRGDVSANIAMRPGDILVIPESRL